MSVPILALAFAIYIAGIAVVLYIRPKIMFRAGGSWKEFGVGRGEDHTVLPFWLFAIFWAFISYGLGLVIMSHFATLAMSAFPEQPAAPTAPNGPTLQIPVQQNMPVQMSIPQHTPVQMSIPQQQVPVQMSLPQQGTQYIQQQAPSFIRPVSSAIGISNGMPGYYVLQTTGPSNLPQYVYYGTEPPAMPRQ
jgi:hypothetical protein